LNPQSPDLPSPVAARTTSFPTAFNGGQPVQIAAGVPAVGAGVVFKGDAVPLIQSLPSEGELAVHLSPRVGTAQDGIFSLAGLETVRAKIATACKWPHAIAKPNNR